MCKSPLINISKMEKKALKNKKVMPYNKSYCWRNLAYLPKYAWKQLIFTDLAVFPFPLYSSSILTVQVPCYFLPRFMLPDAEIASKTLFLNENKIF